MASYETDIIKLQKLWESSQGNSFNLDFNQIETLIYNNQKIQLNPRINIINSIVDTGGQYQPVQLLINQPAIGTQTQDTNIYGAVLSVTITNIPEQWIPFVRFNIGTDMLQPIDEGTLTWFTEVENVNTNGTLVKATWNLSFIINYQPNDFQFKIYLTFVNPTLLL